MSERTPTPPPQAGSTKLVIIALVIALVVVVLTNIYIETVRRQVNETAFEVYVLTRNVQPGDTLQQRDIQAQLVPQRFKDSFDRLQVVDRQAMSLHVDQRDTIQRPARTGDLVRSQLFRTPGLDDRALEVESGKRLIALPVNSASLPGVLQQGMYVDIEAPFFTGGSQPEVLTIMERVQIIALGTHSFSEFDTDAPSRSSSRSYRTITIEVTPQEATDLAMILQLASGPFHLWIRNPNDTARPKLSKDGINARVLELVDRATGRPVRRALP